MIWLLQTAASGAADIYIEIASVAIRPLLGVAVFGITFLFGAPR